MYAHSEVHGEHASMLQTYCVLQHVAVNALHHNVAQYFTMLQRMLRFVAPGCSARLPVMVHCEHAALADAAVVAALWLQPRRDAFGADLERRPVILRPATVTQRGTAQDRSRGDEPSHADMLGPVTPPRRIGLEDTQGRACGVCACVRMRVRARMSCARACTRCFVAQNQDFWRKRRRSRLVA